MLTDTIKVKNDYSSRKVYSLSGNEIQIDTGENTSSHYIVFNSPHLWVGVYEYVPDYPIIETEYTLRGYDLNGNLIGCTLIDFSKSFSVPQSSFYVDNDDNAFAMVCRPEGVYITCPNLRLKYSSHICELTLKAKALTEKAFATSKATSTFTSKTRSEVNQRASDSYNYTWYIHPGNTTAPDGASLPGYIVGSSNNDQKNGIPYCWNHYFSNLTTFDNEIASGYAAGNTNQSTVANTTGLDCSGYV